MILRLCLKNKNSILIKGSMVDINNQVKDSQFIKVENYNTGKIEWYNKDYIWCVRISSENANILNVDNSSDEEKAKKGCRKMIDVNEVKDKTIGEIMKVIDAEGFVVITKDSVHYYKNEDKKSEVDETRKYFKVKSKDDFQDQFDKIRLIANKEYSLINEDGEAYTIVDELGKTIRLGKEHFHYIPEE